MFAECTKTSKCECLVSVLKLEKWMFAECTKTREDECLLSVLKLEKINVCWVY